MKFDWKFFKTTKGIVTLCAAFFFLLAVGIVALVLGVSQQMANAEVEVPPLPVADLLDIMVDPDKTQHMINAELAAINALTLGMKQKNYSKAHDYMVEAVEESTQALGEKSIITCALVGMQAEVEQHFSKWLELEKLERRLLKVTPENEQYSVLRKRARMSLAQALQNQDKTQEAIAIYSQNLTIAEEADNRQHSKTMKATKEALKSLAYCYKSNRNYEQGFVIQERLLNLAKQQAQGARAQAYILAEEGELRRLQHHFNDALSLFAKALALLPADSYIYGRRASLYQDSHDYPAAIKDLSRAIEISPKDNWWYHIQRGEVERKMGDFKSALADAEECIKLDGKWAAGFILRAQIERLMSQDLAALADCETAYKLDKTDPEILVMRSELEEKLGRHQPAVDHDSAALLMAFPMRKEFFLDDDLKIDTGKEKMPLTILALQNRAKAYRALKQMAKADQDSEKAQKLEADWRKYLTKK